MRRSSVKEIAEQIKAVVDPTLLRHQQQHNRELNKGTIYFFLHLDIKKMKLHQRERERERVAR